MHMKEMYFHEIAVLQSHIDIKTFLKSYLFQKVLKALDLFKNVLIFGDLYDSHYIINPYICVASCRHTCVPDDVSIEKTLLFNIT